MMKKEEDDYEDDDDAENDEGEELEDNFEKSFEVVFSDGDKVYFLESNGSWWSNTFKTLEDAKAVADKFRR